MITKQIGGGNSGNLGTVVETVKNVENDLIVTYTDGEVENVGSFGLQDLKKSIMAFTTSGIPQIVTENIESGKTLNRTLLSYFQIIRNNSSSTGGVRTVTDFNDLVQEGIINFRFAGKSTLNTPYPLSSDNGYSGCIINIPNGGGDNREDRRLIQIYLDY